mmetsp:Transcript_25665/g.64513  ORF Transcript_25665/g.64513 Transcript_25665/m.64513 type:complete len:89 (-) Transcript_25665:3046-3312(-)
MTQYSEQVHNPSLATLRHPDRSYHSLMTLWTSERRAARQSSDTHCLELRGGTRLQTDKTRSTKTKAVARSETNRSPNATGCTIDTPIS